MTMFVTNWILDLALRGFVLSAIALVWVVMLIRLAGLRSLSKMTPFDFVMTIASGSLLAGAAQANHWTAFAQTLIAIASLFFLQFLAALARKKSSAAEEIMQNDPVFLYHNGAFNEKALSRTRVSKSDIIAKLREANALSFDRIHSIVLETTGDVSVLHGREPDPEILQGIRDN